MIAGTVILEDLVITFTAIESKSLPKISYTVTNLDGESETRIVSQYNFLAALAIAVHNDGAPTEDDYPGAEAVQPQNPALRFIP